MLQSEALGQELGFSVYVPPNIEEGVRVPAIYWLPDAGGSEAEAGVLAAVHALVSTGRVQPIVVVVPNPGASNGYLDDDGTGASMETAVSRELVDRVEDSYPVLPSAGSRGIGGIGMGGAGAVGLVLRRPDEFAAVASIGGAFLAAPEIETRYGVSPVAASAADPFPLSIEVGPRLRSIPVLIRSGSQDPWVAENRRFAAHIGHQNIEIDFIELPGVGADVSDYLDGAIPEALTFLARTLDRD